MSEPTDDFEYERRFFCRELPAEYDDGDAPTLIIQSYYVHADNYALRVRLVSRKVHVDMTPDVNPVAVLDEYRDRFSEAYVTVKGPSVGGTRYEVEREIDTRIAAELIKRGGSVIIKNRYSVWIEEDGWSVDVFGGPNAPLIVAEAERSGPVTNLTIPKFCITKSPIRRDSITMVSPTVRSVSGRMISRRSWRWRGQGSSSISGRIGWFRGGSNRVRS